jgi:hypothetical protein
MYCKLQKGIKSDEYLQLNNVRKVVEPVWFDWCNSIFIQIPVIKTIHKYNQNKCESLILCVEDIKTSLYKYILSCKPTIYRYKLDMWRFPVLSRQFVPSTCTFNSVLASPLLQGAAPALVRVTPCPFSLFVAAPCPLWLTWISFS